MMRPLKVVESADVKDLVLENELLRHEVIHARARLVAAIEAHKRSEKRAAHHQERVAEVLEGKARAQREVGRLRSVAGTQQARLAKMQRRKKRGDEEVARLTALLAHSEAAPRSESPAARSGGDGETARNDLVWLLRRLDGSPAAWLLRTRPGFRRLRTRYLGGRDA